MNRVVAIALVLGSTSEGAHQWHESAVFWVLAGLIGLEAALVPAIGRWLARKGGSLGMVGAIAASLGVLGAGLWTAFSILNPDLERHAEFMWTVVAAGSMLIGLVAARRGGRVPGAELWMGTVVVIEFAAVVLLLAGNNPGLADPPVRALLVAPAAIALFAYFGASVGYLFWGDSGGTDLALGYEAAVGRRFLLSKSSPVLSTVTSISVVGVSLGVWLVVVALAILSGFEHDLRSKIIGANAHVLVQREGGRTFAMPPDLLERIDAMEGVVASSPYLQGEVAIASRSNYTGGLLFGVDSRRAETVLDVLGENLVDGDLGNLSVRPPAPQDPEGDPGEDEDDDLPPPAVIPGIVVGLEMQKSLNVKPGDRVTVISPLLETLTPLGAVPASRPFETAAVFASKMYEYDARFAFAGLESVRRFFQVAEGTVSGIQVRVEDPAIADRVATRVAAALGDTPCPKNVPTMDCGWEALDWKTRNATLFAALKLERVVAFVVLVFIILVASFSIVNTLTMSVIEKQKEIAILKTMGARDVGVMKIFLVQGMLVGVFGTLVGAALALGTVGYLEKFGIWIPGAVYYIDSLPVRLEAMDVVLVVLAALLIVWDFAVFPALRGSKLHPVEGLRDG